MSINKKFAWAVYLTLFLFFGAAMAGSEVGSFQVPLLENLGGTHQTSYARGDILVASAANTLSKVTIGSTGKVLHSDGTDASWQTLVTGDIPNLAASKITSGQLSQAQGGTGIDTSAATDGQILIAQTGTHAFSLAAISAGSGISVTNGANTITIAAGSPTVSAKTTNYTVLTGDGGTFFDNVGAGGSVNFTLPTAAAGLQYTFYVDAVQTVQITAGASTTIQVGGLTSGAAGNITNAATGGLITLTAISSTKWVASQHCGTWTVN